MDESEREIMDAVRDGSEVACDVIGVLMTEHSWGTPFLRRGGPRLSQCSHGERRGRILPGRRRLHGRLKPARATWLTAREGRRSHGGATVTHTTRRRADREAVGGTRGVAPGRHRLPEKTRLGQVKLQVADLERSLDYYQDILGLRLVDSEDGSPSLAAHGDERPPVVPLGRPPTSSTSLHWPGIPIQRPAVDGSRVSDREPLAGNRTPACSVRTVGGARSGAQERSLRVGAKIPMRADLGLWTFTCMGGPGPGIEGSRFASQRPSASGRRTGAPSRSRH
jgi:catechol 2,3-dioxygenase-like lactoylglutathione lyase family enzyme